MPIPPFRDDGTLPPGIYRATLSTVLAAFGQGEGRQETAELLNAVIAAASKYASIKRVLVWGSFVTQKANPADIDYSLVVEIGHRVGDIQPEHRRFLVPREARVFYGTDVGYLVLPDYPLEKYTERLDFLCRDRNGEPHGILEIELPLKD